MSSLLLVLSLLLGFVSLFYVWVGFLLRFICDPHTTCSRSGPLLILPRAAMDHSSHEVQARG